MSADHKLSFHVYYHGRCLAEGRDEIPTSLRAIVIRKSFLALRDAYDPTKFWDSYIYDLLTNYTISCDNSLTQEGRKNGDRREDETQNPDDWGFD